MIRGIDVSHYQGSVDWGQLRDKYRLSFGAAKMGEGVSFVDSYGKQNRARIHAAGLRFVGYWYAVPSASSPRVQAAKLVALADPLPGDALCLDLEKSSLSQSATNAWMRSFGDALRDLAPGICTIVYLGGYAANGSGQAAVDHFDRWWFPRYASMSPATSWPSSYGPRVDANFTGWPVPHIWQWSPNVAGMDANVSDLTVTELFDLEDIMPTVAEIWAAPITANNGATTSAANWLTQANIGAKDARAAAQATLAILTGEDAAGLDAFATVLAAKFPNGSGLTAEAVAAAVAVEFSTRLGGATA